MSDSQVLTGKPAGAPVGWAVCRQIAPWSALVLLGYLPLLIRLGAEQWARPQYQCFPLLLIAAACLAWQRLHEMPAGLAAPGSPTLTRTLLGLSLLLLLAASILASGRLAAVSACIVLAAISLRTGGWPMLRMLIPAGILLAIAIGLPAEIDEPLLQHLRQWLIWAGSSVLVWLGVPHLLMGTMLELPGYRLRAAESCSGLSAMMAVLGFTLALGLWRRRSAWVVSVLAVSAVVLVLWANLARIVGGVWLRAHGGIDLFSGESQRLAGLVLFALCMGLILSTDLGLSLIRRWCGRKSAGRMPAQLDAPTLTGVPLPVLPMTRSMWTVAVVIALIGIAQVAGAALRGGGVDRWLSAPGTSHLRSDAAFTLPVRIGSWQHSDEPADAIAQPEIIGKSSKTWAYQAGATTAVVAIDYPFAAHHDLPLCYRDAGWVIHDQTENPPRPAVGAFTVLRAARLNEWGYLCYACLDETGQWTQPPKPSAIGQLQDCLAHLDRPGASAASYQIQLWVQTLSPLDAASQEQLSQLFRAARDILAPQVLGHLEGR